MSLKHTLLATGAVIAVIVPAADATAQYRSYERQRLDQYRYERPAAVPRSVRMPRPVSTRTAIRAVGSPVDHSTKRKPAPAPEPPLNPEELAAKAAVDELLAREPALLAAKQKPDPRLAKAAAAKHDAQERKLTALQAKLETAATKRQQSADRTRPREPTKAAAIKLRQEPPSRNRTAGNEAQGAKLEADVRGIAAPAAPVFRMPAPQSMPLSRPTP